MQSGPDSWLDLKKRKEQPQESLCSPLFHHPGAKQALENTSKAGEAPSPKTANCAEIPVLRGAWQKIPMQTAQRTEQGMRKQLCPDLLRPSKKSGLNTP